MGGGFNDGVWWDRRRSEYSRRIRAGGPNRLSDGVEDGDAEVGGPTLAGARTADQLGSHLQHLLDVEGALTPGDALDDDARALVQKNAHRVATARVHSTIF